jgi:two-component system phosphate regulon sensor histidine kinase PhoR
LRVAAAIAGVPVAALMLLVSQGWAEPGAALAAAAAVTAASLGMAMVWAADMRLLGDMLQRAGSGERLAPAQPPILLSTRVLGEAQLVSDRLAERAAQVERLLRAEEAIVERLPDPLIVLGTDHSIMRANAAARAAFGADIQAVLRHPELRSAIDRAIAPGTGAGPQMAELRLPVPVPREVHAMVVALDSPLSGGGGVLAVLSDRSRERAVERTRADFVANASHELRTPLASLIGFIETLRGPAADDPPAQKRFLEIMAEQAERMNRLIDDLLSLSRIEITEHQPPAEIVDLAELVARMLAGFEIRIKRGGTRLEFEAGSDLPHVAGDTDQLEQVMQNLLDNALKYGRDGGLVRVRLERTLPGGRWPARPGVVLSVEDDGAGIARQHLSRLTERFYRVDAGRSRAIGGTGLGLAIVKHILNRHRGVLQIESEVGQGAKFSVWLPAS